MDKYGPDRDSSEGDPDQYSPMVSPRDGEDEGEHLTQLREIGRDEQPSDGSDGEEWAPDGGWGWGCVVGCALAHFVTSK